MLIRSVKSVLLAALLLGLSGCVVPTLILPSSGFTGIAVTNGRYSFSSAAYMPGPEELIDYRFRSVGVDYVGIVDTDEQNQCTWMPCGGVWPSTWEENPEIAEVIVDRWGCTAEDIDEFYRDTLDKLHQDLHFNTLGMWGRRKVKNPGFPGYGNCSVDGQNRMYYLLELNFPDPANFNPQSASAYLEETIIPQFGNDPCLIGYIPWNEINFNDYSRSEIEEYANQVYDVIYEAEEAAGVGHHLIFSGAIGTPRTLEAYQGPWTQICTPDPASDNNRIAPLAIFNAIAVNMYIDGASLGLAEWQYSDQWDYNGNKSILECIHNSTGKPILITETGIGARDSGIVPDPYWEPNYVETQEERGAAYARALQQFGEKPYILGVHWYMLFDGYKQCNGEQWVDYQRNCGIFQNLFSLGEGYFTPYLGLTQSIAVANKRFIHSWLPVHEP
ncbi:TPA: hypothetical protein EYP12_08960 [Candidatus Bipolaricaulota bacterium]|nr:hypothetical protein [Candidatus Bipolaricaulota bacterium]